MRITPDLSPLPLIPARPIASHKGNFGRVLLIGGSRGMAGAIALSGMAALRTGAGLVRLVVPECILSTVAAMEPSYMTSGIQDAHGQMQSLENVDWTWPTAAAIGPGLGSGPQVVSIVQKVVQHVDLPLVVDADGLNALAGHDENLQQAANSRILTPHPGEFQRLSGLHDPRLGSDDDFRAEATMAFSAKFANVVLVLKGARTIVTDGRRCYHNTTGNPAMATGGAGDVLTGMITTLLGQGFVPYDAARLGVYLHGIAGDLAAQQIGPIGVIARDLITHIPSAIRQQMGSG